MGLVRRHDDHLSRAVLTHDFLIEVQGDGDLDRPVVLSKAAHIYELSD